MQIWRRISRQRWAKVTIGVAAAGICGSWFEERLNTATQRAYELVDKPQSTRH
jgi:hypothetical protein